jgi:sec-independent protein translocase protein TatC
MESEQEGSPPDAQLHTDEDEGGGPVKTFLEHLEDLRWMLLKCIAAILVAMLVCLVGGNFLIKLLTWPLVEAQIFRLSQDRSVPIHLGTNVLAKVRLGEIGGDWGTNSPKSFRLVPFLEGTNVFLKLQPDLEPWAPPQQGMVSLISLGPLSGIMVAMKLGLYGGLVLAAPFIFFFVGQFVLPALKLREKKLLYQIVSFGSVLFFMGVAFCYFVITAIALSAAVQFSEWLGFGADQWRAEEYISFMCKFMLGTGLSFELPVVILTIVKIGLLDYQQLKKFRSYWIVISLIISAFVTPSGDPVTMLLLALPLWVLYEISVWVAFIWNRRDRRREEAERKREEEEMRRRGGAARET